MIVATVDLIDFYNGAYGQTLLIALSSRSDLESLYRAVSELTSSESSRSAIRSRAAPFYLVELVVGTARKSSVVRAGEKVVWTQKREKWQDALELIEPLLRHDEPGHQYLVEHGKDEVGVTLSYMEELQSH